MVTLWPRILNPRQSPASPGWTESRPSGPGPGPGPGTRPAAVPPRPRATFSKPRFWALSRARTRIAGSGTNSHSDIGTNFAACRGPVAESAGRRPGAGQCRLRDSTGCLSVRTIIFESESSAESYYVQVQVASNHIVRPLFRVPRAMVIYQFRNASTVEAEYFFEGLLSAADFIYGCRKVFGRRRLRRLM